MKVYVLYLLVLFIVAAEAAPTKDLITDLPGLHYKLNFKQYSGFLKAAETRMLHYWFVESQRNPSEDPVVLWLTGGPGCSSLFAFFNEHGPFRVEDGKTLTQNPFSWNKQANVIYLESPAYVGFSVSPDTYIADDNTTAIDNHLALKDFFKQFPEFSQNDFYVTGESYAGVYVPTLVSLLLDDPLFSKLKGFAVGNGLHDVSLNELSIPYFCEYHGLMGGGSWEKVLDACECAKVTPFGGFCNFTSQRSKLKKCRDLLPESYCRGISDPYNVYADCVNSFANSFFQNMPFNERHGGKSGDLRYRIGCSNESSTGYYLNQGDTRKALHIPGSHEEWNECAARGYISLFRTMKSFYEKAVASKRLRIMIYHGDFDVMCNFLGGQKFVDNLKLPDPSTRKPWYFGPARDSLIGGYFQTFLSSNFTFATIRGAGHMAPYDKPRASLAMIDRFLQNKPLGE